MTQWVSNERRTICQQGDCGDAQLDEDEDEMDEILRLKIENVKLNHQVEKLKLKVATSSSASPKDNGHKSEKAVKSAKQ